MWKYQAQMHTFRLVESQSPNFEFSHLIGTNDTGEADANNAPCLAEKASDQASQHDYGCIRESAAFLLQVGATKR